MEQCSFNGKLIVEAYTPTSLTGEVKNGWSSAPTQKNTVKGLKLLMDARTPFGEVVEAGAMIYVNEEYLHNHCKEKFKSDTLKTEFTIVDFEKVVYITEAPENDPT